MNKLQLLAILITALTLVACNNNPNAPSSINQNIISDSSTPSSEPSSTTIPPDSEEQTPNNPSANTNLPTSLEELQKALYLCKAELSAIDIEESILEADYRAGKIAETDFTTSRMNLLEQEKNLDLKKEQIQMALRPLLTPPQYPAGTIEELLSQLRELKVSEQALELQETQLKQQYRLKEMSRDEFIAQKSELIRQEESLEEQEELLEDALELLGWDD